MNSRPLSPRAFCALRFPVLLAPAAFADNVVHPSTPSLDRPTLTALGVRLPVTGDDNFNANVTLRYRKGGPRPG